MIQTLRLFGSTAITAAFTALLACSGRGQASPQPPAPAQTAEPAPAAAAQDTTAPDAPDWLVVDSAVRVATLELEVTEAVGAPSALINGYRAGEARIIVPLGWTVRWNWRSRDSAETHSLVVMVQREKIPLEGGRAAFSNARTRMVTEGLPAGQTDQSTFVAEEAGWYWMLCGVSGHAIKGEWLELRVDPDAKSPSVKLKAKT